MKNIDHSALTPEPLNLNDFASGLKNSLPIVLGYLPLCITFGILAVQTGLSIFETIFMAFIMYAGSAQFAAVNLLALGMPFLSIVVAATIINARHLLFSTAIAPFLRNWNLKQQALYCFSLTDETFVFGITSFRKKGVNRSEAYGLHLGAHGSWVISTAGGALLGSGMHNIGTYGFDFALAALFICLLVPNIRQFKGLITAVIAGVLSIIFYLLGFQEWAIIIASVLAATVIFLIPARKTSC